MITGTTGMHILVLQHACVILVFIQAGEPSPLSVTQPSAKKTWKTILIRGLHPFRLEYEWTRETSTESGMPVRCVTMFYSVWGEANFSTFPVVNLWLQWAGDILYTLLKLCTVAAAIMCSGKCDRVYALHLQNAVN